MENHPIPQDVTGFKFKLIGSVTLKQFLYLMAAGISCAVAYMLPMSGLLKFPIIGAFALLGIGLAFIPIDGRPMDVMIKNFLKALPSENRYLYRKKGAEALIFEFFQPKTITSIKQDAQDTADDTEKNSKKELLYNQLRMNSSYRPDASERAVLDTINSFFSEKPQGMTPITHRRTDDFIEEKPKHEVQIARPVAPRERKPEIPLAVAPRPAVGVPVVSPTPTLQPQQIEMPVVRAIPQGPQEDATTAKFVTSESQLKAGFPQIPDIPNIVLGIIKDPRGKVIPNVLVEIMDPQQTPVRAFKTNSLGQFIAATPLPNGTYNILLEDPRKTNEFEQLSITLNGTIFQPLEIVSIDQREKLRRELFGTTTPGVQVAT